MLKEKMTQVKTFVVEHKKEITIGVACVVGGVIGYKIVKSIPKVDEISEALSRSKVIKDLDIPEMEVGKIDELWVDGFGKNLILNDCTVGDLGKIGDEFLKIEGVTKDTCVTAVVGLLDKVESVTEF